MSLAVHPLGERVAADQAIRIVEFSSRLDKRPRPRDLTWQQLVEVLSNHAVRRTKDGPGWSPTEYLEGATRSKKGVAYVTALALDFDHCAPPRQLLEGLAWIGHTTFRHVPEDPRWRVVVRLKQLVRGEDWPRVWARAQQYFGASADEQCKDCSRFFYLPACPPGAEHLSEQHDGEALDIDDLPPLPEPSRPVRRTTGTAHVAPGKSRYAMAAFEAELAALARAHEGQRNAQLNSGVYNVAQLVGGGYLNQGDVERAFEATALQIGLEEGETRRTIQSAMEAGLGQPRMVPAPSPPLSAPPAQRTNGHVVDLEHVQPLDLDSAEPPPPSEPNSGDVDTSQPSSFHLTDLGNAQRLVAAHGEDLRYCFQINHWFIWDGARWAEDITAEIERRAKATVRSMYRQASYPDVDDGERKALVKHALKSEAHRSITAMIALARSEHGVPVTTDQLDRDPWLLAVKNGTLDLRTGKLRSHRRSDLITKMVAIEYEPEAVCPTWDAFLDRIMAGNRSLIDFLQRAVGYSLTGSTREQVAFFLHGLGANGKSTLLETISALLGDYARTTRAETLLVKVYDGGIPNDVAALKGARFVSTSETEDGKRLAEALIKSITGGDPLTARFMRGEWFDFKPDFKLWLATNHKPTIRGTDHAIWRRIRLVPFDVQIPDAEQDKDLPQKLQAELDGILAWAVRGCLDWQRSGLGAPEAVIVATQNYRDEMDVLAAFISDCCVVVDGAGERAQKLWKRWETWCQDTGERPGTQKGFGLRLKEKGFQQGRTRDREQARVWLGLGLADQDQQATLDADAFAMQTRPDANPGITGLSASHVDLSRKTRLHTSVRENASASSGESDDDDFVEVEL